MLPETLTDQLADIRVVDAVFGRARMRLPILPGNGSTPLISNIPTDLQSSPRSTRDTAATKAPLKRSFAALSFGRCANMPDTLCGLNPKLYGSILKPSRSEMPSSSALIP